MSRQQLERHLRKLREAREIMNAMKSLAFMETRRLTQRLEAQRALVQGIEETAAELLAFHPELRPQPAVTAPLILLFGSERGFCGSFNDRLLQALEPNYDGTERLIACGHKLCSRLEGDRRLYRALDGASVLDEIAGTLNRLSDTLAELHAGASGLHLRVLYQDPDAHDIIDRPLLPPFQAIGATPTRHGCPPDLNVPPAQCLAEIIEHYLFAELHSIAYLSLMAENQQRMQHLDGAVRYLDERLDVLAQKGREIRQEEITEEIEVILLNSDMASVLSSHDE
ncbi:MAG: F0F1 ATP synthase subunit gamma [Oceanospirillaceae bacterium]|nr:F0F1 ATP synthase subunit gamma [Oceanospirillaceae bacterium]